MLLWPTADSRKMAGLSESLALMRSVKRKAMSNRLRSTIWKENGSSILAPTGIRILCTDFFTDWAKERTTFTEGVCCDMWQSYIDVIRECCGEAVIVFDKFHFIHHLIEASDKVRKMETRAFTGATVRF